MSGNARHISNALTHRQEKAVLALMSNPTIAAAAESVGISEKTLRRWMDEPAFQQALRDAKLTAYDHGMAQLQNLVSNAIRVLTEILNDTEASASAKLRAAALVLQAAPRNMEFDDLKAQFIELREMIERNQR